MTDYLKDDGRMTKEQEAHLGKIKVDFCELVDSKYRAGQKEHGGNLWDNRLLTLVDNALEEAIDLVVYLLTVRDEMKRRI